MSSGSSGSSGRVGSSSMGRGVEELPPMIRKPASWEWGRALALEEWVWVRAAFPVLLVSLVGLSELYPGFVQL